MTGDPEGLGLYGMVTPFGGDYRKHKDQKLWLGQRERRRHGTLEGELIDSESLYLKHDNADLLDTLDNGLWGPCNSYGTLC